MIILFYLAFAKRTIIVQYMEDFNNTSDCSAHRPSYAHLFFMHATIKLKDSFIHRYTVLLGFK